MMDNAYESSAMETGKELYAANLTISCAESCTGGLLTSTLTDVPGSSSYVIGSVVSYSNDVKMRVLQMAEGVRRLMGTDIGISITGIAGPDGGSAEKPVGLVYIAAANSVQTLVKKNIFFGTRIENKCAAVEKALAMIRDVIRSSSR